MRKQKIALLSALAACVLALVATGSLAYFTASGHVTDEFMIASYDPEHPADPDELFSLKITQKDAAGNETDGGRTFFDMAPGSVMEVQPSVVNTGKYSSWMRMNITLTKASVWKKAAERHGISDLSSAFCGIKSENWEAGEVKEDASKDTVTFVYYYKPIFVPDAKGVLMTSFTIPAAFELEEIESLSYFQLKFTADMIQSKNTGGSAKEAFKACWK